MKVGFIDSKGLCLWDQLKSVPELQMRYNEGRNSGYGEEVWIEGISKRNNLKIFIIFMENGERKLLRMNHTFLI